MYNTTKNWIIEGDTGNSVSYDMGGGTIYIFGDCKSISSYIYGGEIYYKGKLIYR